MKTSKSNSPKNSRHTQNIFLSLAGLFLLFLASCSKDNTVSPVSREDASGARTAAIPGRSYETIKIDHRAILTLAADYSVTVNTNGLVTYEGRNHVKVKGKVQFDISREMLKKLDDLFSHPLNTNTPLAAQSRLGDPAIPEHVLVTTTYFNGKDPASVWIDNNTGFPLDVVYRRNKVEQLLGISKYATGIVAVALDKKDAEL